MQTTKPLNNVKRLNNLRGYTFIKSETVALPGCLKTPLWVTHGILALSHCLSTAKTHKERNIDVKPHFPSL